MEIVKRCRVQMMMAVEVTLVRYDAEYYPESGEGSFFQNYDNGLARYTRGDPKITGIDLLCMRAF
jgi:hypothetical protein